MGIHLLPPPFVMIITPPAPQPYEYFRVCDGVAIQSYCHGDGWPGQTFAPQKAHTLTQVKLQLRRAGLPGTCTFSIRDTVPSGSYWVPTGSDLCSATLDGDSLPETSPGEWRTIDFGAGTPLLVDVHYAIIMRAPGGDQYNGLGYRACTVPVGGGYLRGTTVGSTTGGVGWTPFSTVDILFEEKGS